MSTTEQQNNYPSRIIEKSNYYVTMTDKFMSGWGLAEGKVNKYVIGCETFEQAETIKHAAKKRSEMKYVNICGTKPRYDQSVIVSYNPFNTLGEIWTGVKKQ